MEFETARCRGRAFVEEDLEALCTLMSDADVMRHTGFRTPRGKAFVEERLQRWMHDPGVWCVELRGRPEWGVCWFMCVPTSTHEHELGFMLPRSMWGRGIATEVASHLVRTAPLPLVARVDRGNPASSRVLEKVGFHEVRRDASTIHYRRDLREALGTAEITLTPDSSSRLVE